MKTFQVKLALSTIFLCFAQALIAQGPPPAMAPDYLPDKWEEYTFADHNFRVRMPRKPVITSSSDNSSKSTSYKNTSFIEFAVEVMEYAPEVDFEKVPGLLDRLQAAGVAASAHLKLKVIKSADETIGGRTVRFFHAEAEVGGEVIRTRIFVVKNRIYLIYGSVKKAAPHGINHENDFEKPVMAFLDSFQITEKK